MAISFNRIPSARRTPGFVAEVDNSAANSGAGGSKKSILVAQMTSAGTATAGTPIQITSDSQARSKFGTGSMAALMVEAYRANDPQGELWVCPLADATGTPATGSVQVTSAATANGTLHLYVAGKYVPVGVSSGDATTAIATAIGAAVNADTTLPVTASVTTSTATFTARNDGTLGNAIDIRVNYREDQALPAGVAVTITQMASGATDVAVSSATAGMAGEDWYAVIHPYSDDTNLDLWATEFNDTTGRWSPGEMSWGHCWSGFVGTQAELTTHGNGRNDPAHTVFGIEGTAAMAQTMPMWFPMIVAAAAGQCVASLRIDPARPCQTLTLNPPPGYVIASPVASRFTQTERNTLLYDGIATLRTTRTGQVQIEREITTYQTDASSNADDSFLDAQTRHTIQEFLENIQAMHGGQLSRVKLVNDGTPIGAGQAAVTPTTVRNMFVALYMDWQRRGLAENLDAFLANLLTERNGSDPTRLDNLVPPDLVNPLRVFAVKMQHRLQYR